MIRLSTSLNALAILVALATSGAAQNREEIPKDITSFRLGEQVAGSRLVRDDLEGRVVLAYQWCVS